MRTRAPTRSSAPRSSRIVRSDGPVDDEPGKRMGGVPDGQLPAAEDGEVPGAPVLHVIGGVAEMAEVLAAEDIAQPEERFMRHAHQASAPGHPPAFPKPPTRLPPSLHDLPP